jgi:alpha-glucosidase (family GH31 glycosyl hydrolase)
VLGLHPSRMKAVLILLLGSLGAAWAAENPVIEGHARFTVITPQCVRIEYSPGTSFVDSRSLFAVERGARFDGSEVKHADGNVTIDTGVIHLVYKADGSPFHPGNLTAEIRSRTETRTWQPGAPNPGNLGGTIRTLDTISGPVDLGQGVLSRDGWYLLDDSRSHLLTDTWVQSRPANSGTDWYLFGYGQDYKAALRSLVTIGGKAPLPRRYAMGVWFSRYWPFSSDDYRTIIQEYREKNFPLDVIVMDMDWHRDGWTGWSWNHKLIPDPKGLLKWFHEQGLQVTLNLHPADGVAPHEDAYPDFMKAMGEDPQSGKTLPFDTGSERYVKAWENEVLRPLQQDGVDFWWLDWQQYPFTRSIPDLTNLFWLNKVLFDNTTWNGDRGISLSRWAGWGDHRNVVQFSGDADTGWPMLAFEVPFTSTAGNVGCYYWSHDIGGHFGGRNEESYTRWTQFGALSAALRSHSTRDANMDRRPWLYPQWAEDAMRGAFHLRAEILPYVYSSAWQTHQTGIPLNRPLYLDFPRLEEAYHQGQEFMFGDHLLVAPITMPGVGPARVGWQTVWFPTGSTWYNYFTGEKFTGGQTRVVSADIDEFPLYFRGGVPIPMQPYSDRPATAALTTLRLRCYPGTDGVKGEYSLHEDDGHSQDYLKDGYATTQLSYLKNGTHLIIGIAATTGSYRDQPTQRTYQIELPNTTGLTNITLNGKPASLKIERVDGIHRLLIPASDIRQPLQVELDAPEADAAPYAKEAESRRITGIVGDVLGTASLVDLLKRDDLSSDQAQALLALAGVALMPYHESPIFYGEKPYLEFLAPELLIDDDQIRVIHEEKAGDGYQLSSSMFEYGKTSIRLPEDRYHRLEFSIHGKKLTLANHGIQRMGNLAASAHVTASSSEPGHTPEAAIDGVMAGHPASPQNEWAANHQTTGATLTLTWDQPQKIHRIVLHDRPNAIDQIKAGIIRFSDGTTLPVGELPNDGVAPAVLTFPEKTVTSITFEVTAIKQDTVCSGLAEIGVY